MLDPEVFGVSVVVTHLAGGQSSFDAIFDEQQAPISLGSELEVSAAAPRLVAREVDVASVVQGDTVTIADHPNAPGGFVGTVTDVHPHAEGGGLVEIALSSA